MMQHGPLLETLLSGQFICPVTNDTFFRQLQSDDVLSAINDYLRPLNRCVVFSEDKNVAYLSWLQFDDDIRQQLGKQIAEVYQSLLPMLEWMLLVQEVSGRDAVMTANDILQANDIAQRCEDNPSLRERLTAVASDRFFNSNSDDVALQVRQIFRRLLEHGYVVQPNSKAQSFMVTGKIDYLVELVRFLKDEENLPIDDTVAVQEGMAL